MNPREVGKGTIVLCCGIWYVVVKVKKSLLGKIEGFSCICDHANNIHYNSLEQCEYIATAYEAMRAYGWEQGEEELLELKGERNIPIDVIAEVLAGCHDDRWGK